MTKKKSTHLYKLVEEMTAPMIELTEILKEKSGSIPPKSGQTKTRSMNDLLKASDNPEATTLIRKDFKTGYISRPVFSSLIWAYIMLEELQNPDNGREIILDQTLKRAFNTSSKKITMFQIASFFKKATI